MTESELERYNELSKEDELCKLANHSMGVDTIIEYMDLIEKYRLHRNQLSNCCNAPIIENTDLCSKCKEHCETN